MCEFICFFRYISPYTKSILSETIGLWHFCEVTSKYEFQVFLYEKTGESLGESERWYEINCANFNITFQWEESVCNQKEQKYVRFF